MILLCSGISAKFSLAELELDFELTLVLGLAGEKFELDKTLTLEDKETELFDELKGVDEAAGALEVGDCPLLETTPAVELGEDLDPDEESPPPPHAASEIINARNIIWWKEADNFITGFSIIHYLESI